MASIPPPPSRAAAEDTATAQQSTVKTAERTYPFISRREIEALISEGRHIIIVDQYVLKVDAWVKYHPGGDKAIKHMIGRDATDEVNGCVQNTISCTNRDSLDPVRCIVLGPR